MNVDAVVIFGRPNPERLGLSPFTPLASGICIHPDGVIATCDHAIRRFISDWTIYDPPNKAGSELLIDDAERHERPFLLFPPTSIWDRSVEGECEVYPMLSGTSNPQVDLAVIELGGSGRGRPLPSVSIAKERPVPGEVVHFVALYQESDPPLDAHKYPIGFRLIRVSAPVVALRPEGFLIDFPVIPGMSGAGVCNERGSLQGVIIESWGTECSERLVGTAKTLGLCAYADGLVGQYYNLLDSAKRRISAGELPWIGRVTD